MSDRENGVHPSLPKIQGCSACPRLPYARRQTHKPLAHAFLHTLIPPLGQSPPTAALAATPPRGMPGHSRGQPGLPSSPKTPLQGCWGELVSDHKHPPPALPIFSLEKALEGIFFFSSFLFFFKPKKTTPKIIIFLIVSPNINGGTCSSDNTLKEQYRTHCLQRGNVQARGTQTRGGERGQQHTRFTLRREAGDWPPLASGGIRKEVCKVSPWFEALRTGYKMRLPREEACTKVRTG